MLKQLRKNTKVIIWTVMFVFCFWGAYSVSAQFQKHGRVAGNVFGKDVSYQEFNRFVRAAEIFNIQQDNKPEDAAVVRLRAWQNIVYSREAKRLKIEVTDEEARQEIFRLLAAQKIENPSPEQYKRFIERGLNETTQEFEGQIRELLRIQKLIRQVLDSHPVPQPSEPEVLQQFRQDENKIAGEIMVFNSQQEAEDFKKKNSKPEDWAKATKDRALTPGLMPLDSWINVWGFNEEEVVNFHKQPKGTIGGPFEAGNNFMVIKLADKQDADETKFEKEFKEKITKEMTDRRKGAFLGRWSTEVLGRANFKDYTQPPPAPGEPKATVSPASASKAAAASPSK